MQSLFISGNEENPEIGVLRTHQQRKLWTCPSPKNGEISVIKKDNSELYPLIPSQLLSIINDSSFSKLMVTPQNMLCISPVILEVGNIKFKYSFEFFQSGEFALQWTPSHNDPEFHSLNQKNKLMYMWFVGKCRQSASWC